MSNYLHSNQQEIYVAKIKKKNSNLIVSYICIDGTDSHELLSQLFLGFFAGSDKAVSQAVKLTQGF